MSEALNETLHNLVTQISSIRLKTELAMAKHPEVSELTEIVALADEEVCRITFEVPLDL